MKSLGEGEDVRVVGMDGIINKNGSIFVEEGSDIKRADIDRVNWTGVEMDVA